MIARKPIRAGCRRSLAMCAAALLAPGLPLAGADAADPTTGTGLSLSRPLVLAGIETLFTQSSKTRTPDGRTREHLKTKDPACPALIDLTTGITGDLKAAHLLVPASAAAGGAPPIPDCSAAIAERFFSNVAARTPEGSELARHAVADALANPRRAYATPIGDKTASVRFDPDLRGLFAFIDADPN